MYSEIIESSGVNASASIDEVECFLAEPLLDYKNGNPFKWWGENNAWLLNHSTNLFMWCMHTIYTYFTTLYC